MVFSNLFASMFSFINSVYIYILKINYRMETRKVRNAFGWLHWDWSTSSFFNSSFSSFSSFSFLFLLLRLLVEQLVEAVEAWLVGAVNVVPANYSSYSDSSELQLDRIRAAVREDLSKKCHSAKFALMNLIVCPKYRFWCYLPPVADKVLLVENWKGRQISKIAGTLIAQFVQISSIEHASTVPKWSKHWPNTAQSRLMASSHLVMKCLF